MTQFGLALSGGGFRASLYHLGVIRFLHDANLLQNISHITAVSGGSVTAAHLILNWDRYNGDPDSFDEAARELVQFVQKDVRNKIVRRFPLASGLNILRQSVRMGSKRSLTRAGMLESDYRRHLYGDVGMLDLPATPHVFLLSTNLNEGSLCAFHQGGMLMQRRRANGELHFEQIDAGLTTVATAVAASSAFPGFFPPMELSAANLGARESDFRKLSLTDGGIYDNIGLRMFHYLRGKELRNQYHADELKRIFVSNAGATFKIRSEGRAGGLVVTALRSTDILLDRVNQLEDEAFRGFENAVFFPITQTVESEFAALNLPRSIQKQIALIRTDMDHFSDLEVDLLVRHGYAVAKSICEEKLSDELATPVKQVTWSPLKQSRSTSPSLPKLPQSEPASRTASPMIQAGRELRGSSSRSVFSTLFDGRDWSSYFWIPVLLVVLLAPPMVLYRTMKKSRTQSQVLQAIQSTSPVYNQIIRLLSFPGPPEIATPPVEIVDQIQGLQTTGFDAIMDHRIIDLRKWDGTEQKGIAPYMYARVKLLRQEDSVDGHLILSSDVCATAPMVNSLSPNLDFVFRKTTPVDGNCAWEMDFDLSEVPVGKEVDLILEGQLAPDAASSSGGQAEFEMQIVMDTNITQVWLLMPQGRAYNRFEITSFPIDQPGERKTVIPNSIVNLPAGSMVSFQLINPKEHHRYQCKWNWTD